MFREFRKSKNITQEEVSEGIVSAAFLSKFERGQSDLASTKLLKLLVRLNINFHEFFVFFNEMHESSQPSFISQLTKAAQQDNIHLLNYLHNSEVDLYKKSNNFRHKHNQILISQYLRRIRNEKFNISETSKITNYLFNIDDWGYYEFTLFSNSLFFLPNETLNNAAKQLTVKNLKFLNSDQYKDETALVLTNIVSFLIERDCFDDLINIFQIFDNLTNDTKYYYAITRMNFLKGLYLIKNDNLETGLEKANEAIWIMKYMNNFNSAMSFQNYLDDFLKQIQ